MGRTQRSALHAHAGSVASLGCAYAELAGRHRAVADAGCREIGLARGFGVTWGDIAEALGISRQAAWKRFADRPPLRDDSAVVGHRRH